MEAVSIPVMAGAPPSCQAMHLESMGTGSRQEGEAPEGRSEGGSEDTVRDGGGRGIPTLALYMLSRIA